MKTTTIRLGRETTWEVPRGFGKEYLRIAKLDQELPVRDAAEGLIELLGLVGYTATVAEVMQWPLFHRVQANVYAANIHMRASDNAVPRHPKPEWFPEPWAGPDTGPSEDDEGIFHSPPPTHLNPGRRSAKATAPKGERT